MAKIETIIDDLGKEIEIVNIENSVGTGGINNPDDVKIVKALFNNVPHWNPQNSKNYSKGFKTLYWKTLSNGLPSEYDGTVWGLVETTKSFQKYANTMLSKYGFKVSVNGGMKPAKSYAVVGGKYSTIVALNVFANLTHFNGSDLVDFFRKNYDID